jgi:hypothetical protein
MHLQGAIKSGDRTQQPLLEVGDHQVFGRPLALAGGGQALVALLAVAAQQFGQPQFRSVRRQAIDHLRHHQSLGQLHTDLAQVLLEAPHHHIVQVVPVQGSKRPGAGLHA